MKCQRAEEALPEGEEAGGTAPGRSGLPGSCRRMISGKVARCWKSGSLGKTNPPRWPQAAKIHKPKALPALRQAGLLPKTRI